jgi:hypothetical protein
VSESAPSLPLTTPAARLIGVTVAMLANVPLWVSAFALASVGLPMLDGGLLCLYPLAWLFNLVFSGALATLVGQIGGSITFGPDGASLESGRIVSLTDWDAEEGWLAVQTDTATTPQYRFGTPTEIRRAVERLHKLVPPGMTTEERLDGFALSFRPSAPHVDLDFATIWATGANLLGLLPFAVLVVIASPRVSTLLTLGALGLLALLAGLLGSASGAWLGQMVQRRPTVDIALRGRTLEITRQGRTIRTVLARPDRQVRVVGAPTHPVLRLRDERGQARPPTRLTRPAAGALEDWLAGLDRAEPGDATEVPKGLVRMRDGAIEREP